MLEWLEYGEARVPRLNEEMRSGLIPSATVPAGDQPRLILQDVARGLEETGPATSVAGGSTVTGNSVADNNAVRFQHPALFDFARGSRDTIMARSP